VRKRATERRTPTVVQVLQPIWTERGVAKDWQRHARSLAPELVLARGDHTRLHSRNVIDDSGRMAIIPAHYSTDPLSGPPKRPMTGRQLQ